MDRVIDITSIEYNKIISNWEWDYLEFKNAKIAPKDIQKTVSAFVNTWWWEIYIWIGDKKVSYELCWFISTEEYDSILQAVIQWMQPRIDSIKYDFIRYNKQYVLYVNIEKWNKVHYTSSWEAYKRLWTQDIRMSPDEINVLKYTKWESSFEDNTKIIDINLILDGEYFISFLNRNIILLEWEEVL